MPIFTPPRFNYDYNLNNEKNNFDQFFVTRNIPNKRANQRDLATWNIANLGPQRRRAKDFALIAHILSKFDIIAVQEINEDFSHFNSVFVELNNIVAPHEYGYVMTDSAGNSERLAVFYRVDLFEPQNLMGELDYNPNGTIVGNNYIISPKQQSFTHNGVQINIPFYNFNRNPFLSTWQAIGRNTSFMLVNVHVYFGDDEVNNPRYNNRLAEIYFLANWARERRNEHDQNKIYERNIILIGDMNVPRMNSGDPVYRALRRRGLTPTKYSSGAGTTLQEFTTYDQIVFTNDLININNINNHPATVVDFDNFIFRDLWNDPNRDLSDFKRWTKFAISDHRPVFIRIDV